MPVEARKVRIAENEGRFRTINEALQQGLGQLPPDDRPAAYVCECGMQTCDATVSVTNREYEAVRAHSRRFVVMAGHEFPESETVVHRTERFVVVQKHEDVADIVEASDPRT